MNRFCLGLAVLLSSASVTAFAQAPGRTFPLPSPPISMPSGYHITALILSPDNIEDSSGTYSGQVTVSRQGLGLPGINNLPPITIPLNHVRLDELGNLRERVKPEVDRSLDEDIKLLEKDKKEFDDNHR